MSGRIIAIGDIHGCHQEFADLLSRLKLTKTDRLILLGDLVNRGPKSCKVLDLAREHNAIALLGNHERRLLEAYHRDDPSSLQRPTDRMTYDQLRRKDWRFLEAMPLTHEEPEINTVFVHGGFLPGKSWRKQSASIVTEVQVIDAKGFPRKRSEDPKAKPWADFWNGPPYVVYGHTPRPDVYKLKWSMGIDTACAMGGRLTALILPEKRIIQVKAQKRYYP